MNNWKKCKLGDIGKVITGKTPSAKNPEDWGNDMCFITPTDYKDYRKIASSSIRKLSNIGIERLKNKILPPKSIMVTCIGSDMGKVAVNKNPSITNQQINSIIPYEKVADADFVYYLLVSMYDTLRTYGLDGTAVPILNKSDFETIEILLPPLEEQRQIAAILSSIDDKIELLHEQNKTLEELAQTLFRHYFIENPNPSWQNVKLGDLVEETIGGEWGKENPIEDFKVPTYCFRGTDIADLITGLPKKIPLRYIKKAKLEKIEPKSGDILLEISGGTETQSTGRAIYIDDNIKKLFNYPIVFSNFCRLLRAKKIEYSYYLFFYLKYLYGNDEFFAFENGSSGIKNLDYKTLLNNTDCLKPDDEIFSFHKKVVLYFNKINKNKQQIQTLENMRDILIPKLLNGEIKINN